MSKADKMKTNFNEDIMDFKKMAEDIGLDEDEFLDMVELYLETSYGDLNKLQAAANENDMEAVVERAHSLKGASGNMGFIEIYELAKGIEMNARDKNLKGGQEAIAAIREQLDSLADRIKSRV
jgi:HPt (histidine-containing phosphotransfer) domain-containing protein